MLFFNVNLICSILDEFRFLAHAAVISPAVQHRLFCQPAEVIEWARRLIQQSRGGTKIVSRRQICQLKVTQFFRAVPNSNSFWPAYCRNERPPTASSKRDENERLSVILAVAFYERQE